MKAGFERIGRTVTVAAAKRSCLDKKPYASKNKARDAAARNKRMHPDGLPQRPYRCTLCHGFHLTTKVPAGLRRKGKRLRDDGPDDPAAKQSHDASQRRA